MKKILTSAIAAAALCGIAFADVHVNFYNKLYSEDPILRHHYNETKEKYETDAYFPGIKERMYADISTDKVDAGVKGTIYLNQDWNSDHFYLKGKINDWWVEFRPIDMLTLGLHDSIWADGSYLPIWDDNVTAGNIGSDGFTVVFRPIPQLRLAATVPSGIGSESDEDNWNWLNGSARYKEEHKNFHFGTGAIFDADVFQISANISDIPCSSDRQFGTFINMPGLFGIVEELSIGAGFTHAWGRGALWSLLSDYTDHKEAYNYGLGILTYENLLNAYVTYDADSFDLTAELACNFDFDNNRHGYDFYTAVAISFGLADKLTATATGKLLHDFADSKYSLDNGYGASFAIDYEVNKRNMVGAKAEVNIIDDYWDFAIPVYWKYMLSY